MSCADYLERVANPSEAQVREMLSGHLCRCTGYTPIVKAVLDVAAARQEARIRKTQNQRAAGPSPGREHA